MARPTALEYVSRPEFSGVIVCTEDRNAYPGAPTPPRYFRVDTGTATGARFDAATPDATLKGLAQNLLRFGVVECGEKPSGQPTLKALTAHLIRLRTMYLDPKHPEYNGGGSQPE